MKFKPKASSESSSEPEEVVAKGRAEKGRPPPPIGVGEKCAADWAPQTPARRALPARREVVVLIGVLTARAIVRARVRARRAIVCVKEKRGASRKSRRA